VKDKGYKFYLEAEMKPVKETVALKKEVASVVDLPKEGDRQPDLSYFSSIFVSTGTNLNNAHFLASELVMAEGTITSKAVDIEHEEDQIIGHIYHKAFVDSEGDEVLLSDLKNSEIAALDKEEYHIAIASVIYKTRFPQIAQEVAEGKWKVSMEAYFQDFDVKVGDTILSKDEAASLGLDVFAEANYGKQAQVVKAGKVIAEGTLARVLRGICFSGVGIVKNPANPPSVVLDATASKDNIIVLDYDKEVSNNTDNNVTNNIIDNKDTKTEQSELQYDDTVGVCVHYQKELLDDIVKTQDTKVLETQWCMKYERTCPVTGEYQNPECLAKTIASLTKEIVERELDLVYKNNKINKLTDQLLKVLKK
jgi:hypothetical protein